MALVLPEALKREKLIENAMLEAMEPILAPLASFSSDFSAGMQQFDGKSQLLIPFIPLDTGSSRERVGGDYVINESESIQTKLVDMAEPRHRSISDTDMNNKIHPYDIVIQQAQQQARGLALDAFKDVTSLITLANFSNSIVVGDSATFDISDITNIRNKMDELELGGQASITLTHEYYNKLSTDRIFENSVSGNGSSITSGFVRNFQGFNFYKTGNLGCPPLDNIVGWATMPQALLVGFTTITPADGFNGTYEETASPELKGFKVGIRDFTNQSGTAKIKTLEAYWGKGLGDTRVLVPLISA